MLGDLARRPRIGACRVWDLEYRGYKVDLHGQLIIQVNVIASG